MAMVIRPGLIVGPGDPTGRFSYWPARMGEVPEHPEVLAPGDPEDSVQVIDVRDLAAWIVDSAEARRTGVFDGIGSALPIRDLLSEVAAGAGVAPQLTWVPQEFLADRGYDPAFGARPLRRTIQHLVEDQLSEKILFGEITPGSSITVDLEGEGETAKLTFSTTSRPEAIEATPVAGEIEAQTTGQ